MKKMKQKFFTSGLRACKNTKICRFNEGRNKTSKLNECISMFFFSLVLINLILLLYRYQSGKQRVVCYMLWPDGKYPTSLIDYVYVIHSQLIHFVLHFCHLLLHLILFLFLFRFLSHSISHY